MSKFTLMLLTVLMLAPYPCRGYERARNDNDIYECCCRIYCDSSTAGSGTIIAQEPEGAYVLTNYHVAGTASKIECHFMGNGHIVNVSATRVWRAYNQSTNLDATILLVKRTEIDKVTNKFVPVSMTMTVTSDASIVTCGAPSAKWVKLIHGSIYEDKGSVFSFRPTPYGGQSGSSIIEYDAKGRPWVVGLLTWRSMDEGIDSPGGLAQPISKIVKAAQNEMGTSEEVYSGNPLPKNAVITPYKL